MTAVTTLTEDLPPVRRWPAVDPTGTEPDPAPIEVLRGGPVARIRLPDGAGRARLHPSFGFGPHYGPGGQLARPESELLVDALPDRIPDLRPAGPPEQVLFEEGRADPGARGRALDVVSAL